MSATVILPFSLLADLLGASFGSMRAAFRPPRSGKRSLLLLRHAQAERGSARLDEDRRLTSDGRDDVRRLGTVLATSTLVPDAIVSSPARRATETATTLATSMGFPGAVELDEGLYRGGAEGFGAALRKLPVDARCALVVGHDPTISRMLEQLTGTPVGLPPGGLAALLIELDEWARIGDDRRSAKLLRLWRPQGRGEPANDTPLPSRDARRSKWPVSGDDDRVLDAAARAVEEKLEDTLERLAEVADGPPDDSERVHKLRVATRRAEAALRTFRDVLPPRARRRARELLRAIRDATDAARDIDVLVVRMESAAPVDALAVLQQERRKALVTAQGRCRRLSDDGDVARAFGALVRKVHRRVKGDATKPLALWARARIAQSTRRFLRGSAVDLADLAKLHDFRLRTKRLRYEVELLASVLPTDVRIEAYPVLTELQDRLGAVSDGAVMRERLRDLSTRRPIAVSGAGLDLLLCEADRFLEHSLADLAAWWTTERAESLRIGLTRATESRAPALL